MKKTRAFSLIVTLLFVMASLLLTACTPTQPPNGDNGKSYTFTYNGYTAAIGAESEPVITGFGEYRDMVATGSCAFEEQDKTYTYPGFRLLSCYIDGTYRVRMIEFYDDTVATPEGIRIGSSREDILTAYGEADEASGNDLRYQGTGMYLTFFCNDDGTVRLIQYMQAD